MRALLLSAGLGTRLRPLTLRVPKCLVPIHGKPLLDYWLEHLFAAATERVLINTHWLPEVVREHVARSPWRDRIDLVHEDKLLGTAGTVLANREWLGDRPFLLAHADNLTDFDLGEFRARHSARPPGCAPRQRRCLSLRA
jgi:mannose-1-phosphate guanylyltransferase